MATRDLPDNSYAAREKPESERERDRDRRSRDPEREPVEKAISGTAIRKKKTLGRKIVDFVLGEDINKINDYVKYDVLGPGIKNLAFDIIVSALSMGFYGEARRGGYRGDRESSRSRRTAYDRMYDDRREMGRTRSRRPSYDIDDIIFETQADAEDARKALYSLVDDYGRATVADLDRIAGISGPWTDKNYGWHRLDRIDIVPVPEGYVLDLPPCEDVR